LGRGRADRRIVCALSVSANCGVSIGRWNGSFLSLADAWREILRRKKRGSGFRQKAPARKERALTPSERLKFPGNSSDGTCYHCFAVGGTIEECPECVGKPWSEEFLRAKDEIEGPDAVVLPF
jgi:hypothetical protein